MEAAAQIPEHESGRALLDEVIREIAPIVRPPGSDGERGAAELVAERLRGEGCRVEIETHPIHGAFWSPIAALSALAVAGGAAALSGRRALGAVLGAVAGAGLVDEITCRSYLPRRLLGRRRTAWNVVAETGDPGAQRTVVVMAHHDAAQSGLVFHPGPQRWIGEHFPKVIESSDTAAPMWWPTFAAPGLVALGAASGRRGATKTGMALAATTVAAMADIGRRGAVPGANDNLTGVAVLVALARRLREKPVPGLRVVLLSAGAEESLQEGIRGFAERHFAGLPRESTWFVNVDTLGCPILVLLEGEGALRMEEYDEGFKDRVAACAERAGIPLRRGMRARTSTDGVVPMRAGFPTATLVSMNAWKALDNYHWPSDVPDNVELGTVEHALALCDAVVRELGT
jgi:hypothetical protein